MRYLGYQVSTVGIAPQYEYLYHIRAWPRPKSRDELRAYLGLFPFLSVFSPCTSTVLSPLQNLLGKKRSVSDWSSKHDECFVASKLLFDGEVHFEDKAAIEVKSDARAYGLGRALIQNHKPVWCVSASMTESQKVCGATDRELLAVKEVIKKLSRFLWGRSFTAVTDHEPVLGLFQKKNLLLKYRRRWYCITSTGECCWHNQKWQPRGRKVFLRESSH